MSLKESRFFSMGYRTAVNRSPACTQEPSSTYSAQAIWRRAVYTAARAPDEEFMLQPRRRFKPQVMALGGYPSRDMVAEWGM